VSRLVEEGWVAPADPGPGRRWRAGAAILAIPMLTWLAMLLFSTSLEGEKTIEVRVADDGTARAVLVKTEKTAKKFDVELDGEVRTSRGTRFLVVRGEVPASGGDDVEVRVEPPIGVDEELVTARYAAPRAGERDGRVLVTLPAESMPDVTGTSAGSLRDLTAPMDERVTATRDDERLRHRLERDWWWIALGGLLVTIVAPLLLWRRECGRFFSMRVPGPGKQLDAAPPSSLDPVGAAVLLAGAHPVDPGAAFAGHVLDLVERRQLRLRRNTNPEAGAIGAQLGLAHADEEAVPDDVAVAALRAMVRDDDVTVDVPDDPRRARSLPADLCARWNDHVAARARFERAAVSYPAPRVAAAAAAAGAFAIAGVVGGLLAPYPGGQLAGWLVLALALPLAIVLGAWMRDARRWRIVARERRHERAQWVAWRRVIGTKDGPALDQRNVPLIAATGPVDGLVRANATKDSVGLDAVTIRTIDSLRTMCAGPAARADG
jgi:hypothetical protein